MLLAIPFPSRRILTLTFSSARNEIGIRLGRCKARRHHQSDHVSKRRGRTRAAAMMRKTSGTAAPFATVAEFLRRRPNERQRQVADGRSLEKQLTSLLGRSRVFRLVSVVL